MRLESESKRQQILMGVNTGTTVSAIITRETTFSDFLFVLWYIVSL